MSAQQEQIAVEVVSKGGRPSKYDPVFCEVAYQLYIAGATDAEVAKALDVNSSTLYRWVAEHEEFRNTQRLGKVAADERVERSLYHRATGYSHKAVKIFCDPKTGKNSLIEYVEHYPPDTTACIFWLKNRRPAEWKDKHDIEVTYDPRAFAKSNVYEWLAANPGTPLEEALEHLAPLVKEVAEYRDIPEFREELARGMDPQGVQ